MSTVDLEAVALKIRDKMSNGPPWTDVDYAYSQAADIVARYAAETSLEIAAAIAFLRSKECIGCDCLDAANALERGDHMEDLP